MASKNAKFICFYFGRNNLNKLKSLLLKPSNEVKYHREIFISNSGNAGGYIYQNDSECGSGEQLSLRTLSGGGCVFTRSIGDYDRSSISIR